MIELTTTAEHETDMLGDEYLNSEGKVVRFRNCQNPVYVSMAIEGIEGEFMFVKRDLMKVITVLDDD